MAESAVVMSEIFVTIMICGLVWSYLQDNLYSGNPHVTEELKQNIERGISTISIDSLS
jgi:hypothetical protein